ncbi:MAG: HEPN domain-containing protein [Paludibacteraceae bacterium]|nr:HEPN domain-containing protein [Paludibacteraceae bacterium]
MSLEPENKAEMIRLHFEKAHQYLADAELLIASNSISSATGRLYYAVFHAVHALFVANGISSKTHHGMNALFNEHFVRTGLIDIKYGRLVALLENMREKADYDVVFDVKRNELETLKPAAYEFVQRIEQLLA